MDELIDNVSRSNRKKGRSFPLVSRSLILLKDMATIFSLNSLSRNVCLNASVNSIIILCESSTIKWALSVQ